ncbi:MAG: rhomboid family intramembrane serine protease [Chitinophagales bacterium]|nr:rhomboid family intramembrane serine protease [Bacteroidota bacterium]
MTQFQPTRFNFLPPVIKNLLILNGLVFLATITFPDLMQKFALYFPTSPDFQPYQIVTHMFTHADIGHIFFNMFSLWMFGSVLENFWGPKRFLTFYLITGLGAAFLHMGVNAYELYNAVGTLNPSVIINGDTISSATYSQSQLREIVAAFTPTVGASGAVFGIFVAYGMLFPNTLIYLYFLFPIKAKYLMIVFIAIELYMGFINSPDDNIAHFAHLGGALFGFILVKYWSKDRRHFY